MDSILFIALQVGAVLFLLLKYFFNHKPENIWNFALGWSGRFLAVQANDPQDHDNYAKQSV